MTVYEAMAAKMVQLPEPLVQEVSDFVDFLLMRRDGDQWQQWICFREALHVCESDLQNYSRNLEDYESRLARDEIRW